ncbi:MAG: cell division protein FtsL [Coriobacteriaceae bacterium]|nr:MAG: cell division protein FtsL [Coriobacteriaceae bacterium]
MTNLGSEAYSFYGNAYERPREDPRRSFEVVEGGGLDARVRRGVSTTFWSRFKLVIACALVLAAVGVARVALTAAAVSNMMGSSSLEQKIKTAETTNSDLKIERSVLSSSSRVNAIATQNYGMVPSTSSESMSVSGEKSAASTSTSTSTSGSASDSTSSSATTSDSSTSADSGSISTSSSKKSAATTDESASTDSANAAQSSDGTQTGSDAA